MSFLCLSYVPIQQTHLKTLNFYKSLLNQIHSGAWIRSSTSATGIALTDTLTLDKGTYLVLVNIPPITSGTALGQLVLNGREANRVFSGSRLGYASILDVPSDDSTLVAKSAASASTAYTSLAEGGIYAIKLA